MRSKIRNHLSPSLLLALLALFAALGGGAYAAGQVKKNSVDSKSVLNNSLKGGDIQNETLTGADVRDGTLSGDDIQSGSIKPADLQGGGAVTGAAIVDNSVTGADINESTLDMSQVDVARVVARARSTGSTPVDANNPTPTNIPLTGNTYARTANQTDLFFGSFTVNFPADCAVAAPGAVTVQVYDGTDPVGTGFAVIAMGQSGAVTGFFSGNDSAVEAGAKDRTLGAIAGATCDAGSSDPSLSNLKIDVQGIR